ncbi:hypothetical protein SLEP1_g2530 [Rubroshorea leprosula]|uniref:CCHC-type domain-containing protein n=1 Tax=Rubroshorea leprosula TaxID=152421 RepID=A0AAV5HR70_9ROSI|nr:hypothetical protein SLEP1_g2520 [Rubroshorea leprosula]GKU88244.1 hypothetical protein SLEP1_g2530 [Rubroshorea leprosula]
MADGGKLQGELAQGGVLESHEDGVQVQSANLQTETKFANARKGKVPEVGFSSEGRIPEHKRPWKEQRWRNILTKDELTARCTRCQEIGHRCMHCPYPICYLKVPNAKKKGPGSLRGVVIKGIPGNNRCARCGRFGHNKRNCHGPINF